MRSAMGVSCQWMHYCMTCSNAPAARGPWQPVLGQGGSCSGRLKTRLVRADGGATGSAVEVEAAAAPLQVATMRGRGMGGEESELWALSCSLIHAGSYSPIRRHACASPHHPLHSSCDGGRSCTHAYICKSVRSRASGMCRGGIIDVLH